MKESRVREALKLAFAAGARRDYHTAARLLEEIITETEAPSETYLLLGRSYHALGDYPRALLAFKDFLRYKPHSAQGLFFAGRSYLALGMIDEGYSAY
ncbi:hypothetical protein MASR2M78_03910 [Treponema sp.]